MGIETLASEKVDWFEKMLRANGVGYAGLHNGNCGVSIRFLAPSDLCGGHSQHAVVVYVDDQQADVLRVGNGRWRPRDNLIFRIGPF